MYIQKVSLLCLLLLLFGTVADAKIVFSSWGPGPDMLYVMDDDGSNVTLLTNQGRPWAPRWSPDGKSIAFNSKSSIFLINADGTDIHKIIEPPKDATDTHPAFSPGGKSVVFKRRVQIRGAPNKYKLNVLNLKTGKIREIADVHGVSPDWSPDGKYIVCGGAINVDGLGSSIWIMNANGSNLRKIIPSQRVGNSILSVSRPRWSPDSQKIVYATMKYHWRNIAPDVDALIREEFRYIICDKNGNTLKTLNIPKDFEHGTLAWMDNGKSIVFAAAKYPINEPPPPLEQYPVMNIYTYHIQSGKLTQLTDTERNESGVDWISDDVLSVSPKGKMQTQWGAIKKFLQSRSEAFKSLSQNVLFFLRNQR